MEILGTSLAEWAVVLFIGMGPVRAMLGFIPVAHSVPRELLGPLARRTVIVAFWICAGVVLFGGLFVRAFELSQGVLLAAAGLAFSERAFAMLATRPSDAARFPEFPNPMRLALSPLAVPAMISSGAVVALLIASAGVSDLGELAAFGGLVVGVLLLNLGAMHLSTRATRFVTVPVLEVIQQLFGVLLLGLGIRLTLEGLDDIGVLDAPGL